MRPLNRQIKKKNEPQEALEARDDLYTEIYANEDKAVSLLVQKVGINETEIKDREKLINNIEREIVIANKNIERCNLEIEKTQAKAEKADISEEEKKKVEEARSCPPGHPAPRRPPRGRCRRGRRP